MFFPLKNVHTHVPHLESIINLYILIFSYFESIQYEKCFQN
jgi:hypothetical protein